MTESGGDGGTTAGAPMEGSAMSFESFFKIVEAAPPPKDVLEETVSIIMHIAALENPPGRIIVSAEGTAQVKDRLKIVSEELEECLGASLGADIPKE